MEGHGGHRAAASPHNAVHDADYAGSRDSVETRAEARVYHLPRGSGMSCAGAVETLGHLHLATSLQG